MFINSPQKRCSRTGKTLYLFAIRRPEKALKTVSNIRKVIWISSPSSPLKGRPNPSGPVVRVEPHKYYCSSTWRAEDVSLVWSTNPDFFVPL
jgi:hypothetical protein